MENISKPSPLNRKFLGCALPDDKGNGRRLHQERLLSQSSRLPSREPTNSIKISGLAWCIAGKNTFGCEPTLRDFMVYWILATS
jgi:hypothetical protein